MVKLLWLMLVSYEALFAAFLWLMLAWYLGDRCALCQMRFGSALKRTQLVAKAGLAWYGGHVPDDAFWE